jgi:hypothetical protein
VPEGIGSANFYRSLSTLPNFLYWVVMILFFIWYRSIVDIEKFRKYVFYGVAIYLPFWFIHQSFLKGIPFFQNTSPNNLALLMICYSPIAVSYLKYYKTKGIAILFFIVVLGVMLYLERRAGFALVLISGLLTLFVTNVRFKNLLIYGIAFLLMVITMQFTVVKDLIESSSPRIYQLIYESDELVEQDQSYLFRMALIEKGVNLFEKHPYTGVGLFNFNNTEGEIEGNFEGAQLVINKEELQSLGAHNSYVAVLSEGGLFMFVPFVLILTTIILKFGYNIYKIDFHDYPIFWGCFGMLVHYSSGTGYVNVYSWFMIAICTVILTRVGEAHVNNYKAIKNNND